MMTKGNGKKQRIQEILLSLAEDIPVPNIDDSFKRLEKRFKKKQKYFVAAVIFLGVLAVCAFFPEPVKAIPRLFHKTYSFLIGDTLELHQRSSQDENREIIEKEPSVQYFNSLSNLREDSISELFIPAARFENEFIYAEVHRENDMINYSKMELCFEQKYNLELQQFLSDGMTGSGRIIDTEDYETTVLHDFNTEVLAFTHKSGLVTLEWDDGAILYLLSGSVGLDKIVKFVQELQLFNN